MSDKSDWVRERKLAEAKGLSKEEVRLRRNNFWIEGLHWKWGPDNRLWYNLEAINEWVDQGRAA